MWQLGMFIYSKEVLLWCQKSIGCQCRKMYENACYVEVGYHLHGGKNVGDLVSTPGCMTLCEWFLFYRLWFPFVKWGLVWYSSSVASLTFWNNYTSKGHFDIECEEQTEVGVLIPSWCDEVKGASQSHPCAPDCHIPGGAHTSDCHTNLQRNCWVICKMRFEAEQKSKDSVGSLICSREGGLLAGPLLPGMLCLCYACIFLHAVVTPPKILRVGGYPCIKMFWSLEGYAIIKICCLFHSH